MSSGPLSRDQDYSRSAVASIIAAPSDPIDGWHELCQACLPPWQAYPDHRASEVLSIAELLPGEPQRVTLSSYQSIVPATRRGRFVASADTVWHGVTLAADLLWVTREAYCQYFPAIDFRGGERGASGQSIR